MTTPTLELRALGCAVIDQALRDLALRGRAQFDAYIWLTTGAAPWGPGLGIPREKLRECARRTLRLQFHGEPTIKPHLTDHAIGSSVSGQGRLCIL